MMAGIQVVVGESIERIYKENCQNLGILTTTDFDMIDRIERGEEISLQEFTRGTDEITRQIIEYGGLFEFNVARIQATPTVPPPEILDGDDSVPPMTLAGEDLRTALGHRRGGRSDRGAGRDSGRGGVLPHRYPLLARVRHTDVSHLLRGEDGVGRTGRDPESVLFFRDH